MTEIKARNCKCGCGLAFTPKIRTQRYYNRDHRNRAAQKRLRKRARINSNGTR